jgi:ribosomal protein L29
MAAATKKTDFPRAKTLNEMTPDELRAVLAEARKEKMSIDGHIRKGDVGLSGKARNTRKTIARCITILTKRGERCVVTT